MKWLKAEYIQLPVASSTPPTTFFPFPKPIRPRRRSTRRRTRCKDRPIPSPRLPLNDPCRRIDAAKCDPKTPDSKSSDASFEPRNQRTMAKQMKNVNQNIFH